MLVGGGFGGKEDVSVQHHAALLAYRRPRAGEGEAHPAGDASSSTPSATALTWTSPWAATKTASFRASGASVVSDTGAFASLGGPVLERACTHAAGPYAYQNFEIEGRAYYTNNPPAGAFRGFGVTQTCFCTESAAQRDG